MNDIKLTQFPPFYMSRFLEMIELEAMGPLIYKTIKSVVGK